MKNYLNTTWFHFKAILKQPLDVLLILVAPIIPILILAFTSGTETTTLAEQNSYIVNNSTFISENIEAYSAIDQYFIDDLDEAILRLSEGDVSVVYEIPADFPSNTAIDAYSIDGTGRDYLLETELINISSEEIFSSTLREFDLEFNPGEIDELSIVRSENMVSGNMMFTVYMIAFMQLLSTLSVTGTLNQLRNNDTLKRSLISRTPGRTVLASILSAYGIFYVIAGVIATLLAIFTMNLSFSMYWLVLLYLGVFTIFTLGMIMLLFRLVKDVNAIRAISMLVAFVIIYLAILGDLFGGIWERLAIFSPLYWFLDGLDRAVLFPNLLIILAMGLVLFTAGTMKVEKLVNVRA